MEKVAWTEFLVSITAVAVVGLLIPWLGQGAMGAFGLLGLLGFCGLFMRRRGNQVVFDERDLEIQRRAMLFGFGAAWMLVYLTLFAIVMWAVYSQAKVVSIECLNWLLWSQFAFTYGVKGLVAVMLYRRHRAA